MSMELEYPVKIIILLIVAFAAISMIYNFYTMGQHTVNDILPKADKNGDIVAQRVDDTNKGSLSTADIEKYCMLCSKIVEEYNPESDAVCYIVKGDFAPTRFPEDKCGSWECDDWEKATNIIISYDWRNSLVRVEC